MDRTPYDAPARGEHPPQHGIAHAPTEPDAAQRSNRPSSDPEVPQRTPRSTTEQDASQPRPNRSLQRGSRLLQDRAQRTRGSSLREQFTDLLSVRSIGDLQHRVRDNPLGAIALAAGIGFALQRTHLLDAVVGGLLADDVPDELTPADERLLAWLNDAYALEKAQIAILKNHAEDALSQPHVREKDLEHLDRTREHVRQVRQCIRLLGSKPSKAKGAIGRIGGAMNSLSTEPFDDEVVRNFLADFAAENLEVASYQAIIVAARDGGHEKIARICEDILEDEEEMADWLRTNLPRAVRDTLGGLDILEWQPATA